MKRLLLLTIALILYGSLYPWHFDWWRSSESPLDVLLRSWPRHVDRWVLRDVVLNLLLYTPLGLTAFLAVARRHSRALAAASAVVLGAALSAGVEIAQVYVPGRVSSLLDVTTNCLGTVAGVFAAAAFQSRIEALLGRRRHHHAPAAALLLACWAACQLYPFIPALTHSQLRATLRVLITSVSVSPPEVWAVAAEWFAALLALGAVFGRWRNFWLAGVPAVLALRLLTVARILTPNEVLGSLLAVALWLAIPQSRRLSAALWWMASALLLRELAPFHLSFHAQPFAWIPFTPTLESERQSAVVIIARKAFDYGAMVWLLRQRGVRYRQAGLAVAAVLFVCERIQIYLPGRTPEITDAVLALLMAAALWMADSRVSASPPAARPARPSSRT